MINLSTVYELVYDYSLNNNILIISYGKLFTFCWIKLCIPIILIVIISFYDLNNW
mgnify:CR=1 FL=1